MMKTTIAVIAAVLLGLAACGHPHPAPKHTSTPAATVMPAFSGPSPTCRPSNYANIPGTRTYGKKKCK